MNVPPSLTGIPCWAINLDRRPDRWQRLTAHLQDRGLPAPARWRAIDGSTTVTAEEAGAFRATAAPCRAHPAPRLATARTFLALTAHLLDDPPPWTLVLEDDAVLHEHVHARYTEFADAAPDDALMVLLGCTHRRKPRPVQGTCWRVTRAVDAHAFLASADALPLLHAAAAPLTTDYDQAWNDVHRLGHTYAPMPHLAIQRPDDHSDLLGRPRPLRRKHLGLEAT
ncbi:hypothetical protein [Actinomadura sp. K4S16]|uniref:hypothetical protein n=1 Tax=Actinomadura sp. K4S16 TaxID=1316147 RepID=UPI001359D498|nr:hypothetical protein [Actinomadura sp. K4S16]